MIELVGRYEFQGDYLLDGLRGFQKGSVGLYSDGKLIGKVQDTNSHDDFGNLIYGKEKLLLGARLEKGEIGFLKLVPCISRIAPVIWHAVPENESFEKLRLVSCYNGYWQFAQTWTPADDLQVLLNAGMPSETDLMDCDCEHIKGVYFSPERLEILVTSATLMGKTGSLRFREVID